MKGGSEYSGISIGMFDMHVTNIWVHQVIQQFFDTSDKYDTQFPILFWVTTLEQTK